MNQPSLDAIFTGVASRKLNYLTDRGAVVICVTVEVAMPNGERAKLNNFGRCEWDPARPPTESIASELNRLFTH